MTILIFGDSVAWGAWDKEGGWAQRIKKYTDELAISSKMDTHIETYPLGVSGDTTTELLKRFESEIHARRETEEDTLVLIQIGINDSQYFWNEKTNMIEPSQYASNLGKLIVIAKNLKTQLILVGLTPVDDTKVDPTPWTPGRSYKQEFAIQYEKILKNVALENSIPFIEVMTEFLGQEYQQMLTDGIHPNTQGHKIIYEKVKDHLQKLKVI